MTVAAVSFVTYVIAGFVQNAWICLPIGIVLMTGTLFVIRAITGKEEQMNEKNICLKKWIRFLGYF